MGLSLIPFHRGLIAAAIVFCFGYAAWELGPPLRNGAGRAGIFPNRGRPSSSLASGLIYYLARLNRFLGFRPGGGCRGTGSAPENPAAAI